MTTTTDVPRRRGARPTRYAMLCLLALFAVLCHTHEARAQWTTSGTNTTTTNNVGIGTATPTSKVVISSNAATPPAPQDGTILHLVNTDNVKTRLTIDGFGGPLAQPSVTFRSARGTAAAPTATQTNDLLGVIHGTGYGTSGFLTGSKPSIMMIATENWTDTAAGSAIFFNTVKNGTNTTAERMRLTGDGKLGIATTAPLAPLHVSTGGPSGGVAFFQKDSASNGVGIGTTNGVAAISGVNANYTTTTDLLINPYGGNVGIGTAAPTAKLHVAGDIRIDGNINAKYQDVAEWVPSTQKLAAGTVVVLDPSRDNHVAASAKSYDTRVAGVVSARPGISLGEAGEGKALVATTGRVKVRVDATRGAIRVGDLLVTSDVEGVAMLSQPLDLGGVPIHRPGTIIGKALEPLASGTGEILVLLSLQ